MEQIFHNSSLENFRVGLYFEMYVCNGGFILSRSLRMMIYDFQNLSSLNLGLIQFLGQQSVGDFRIFSWFSKSTWREQVWCIQKVQRWCLSNFSTLKYYVSLLNWVLAHQKFRNPWDFCDVLWRDTLSYDFNELSWCIEMRGLWLMDEIELLVLIW